MEDDILFAAFRVLRLLAAILTNLQRTKGTSVRSCVSCGRLGNQYKQHLPITANVGCPNNCRHRSRENRFSGSQTFLDGKMLFFHMLLAPVLLATKVSRVRASTSSKIIERRYHDLVFVLPPLPVVNVASNTSMLKSWRNNFEWWGGRA